MRLLSYFSPLPAEMGRDIYTLSNKCGMVGGIIILWGIFELKKQLIDGTIQWDEVGRPSVVQL